MKKNTKILIIVILILLILFGVIFCKFSRNKLSLKKQEEQLETIYEEESVFEDESTPEEEQKEHNLKLTIVGPKEDVILRGQARMYDALVEGNGKYSKRVRCSWKFYLNENNEEVLFREQDTSNWLSEESENICGFTSTFIDKIGKLRVVLTMTVYDATNDNIETITAEREYTVLN
ncbi:MAG: hypothetical protein ACOX0R_01445 [Candidatus Dojkabacteria bacterium]